MLIELGFRDQIVGVGRYDPIDLPDARVVGDSLQIDYESLVAVRPTHVLIQPERNTGVPDRLAELAARNGWLIGTVRIDTVDDALDALHDPDMPARGVGAVVGARDAARQLRLDVEAKLDALRAWSGGLETRPRVMMVFRTEPLGVVGTDTFLDEMLRAAGGVNAFEDAYYVNVDHERVLAARPDVILLLTSPKEYTDAQIDTWRGTLADIDVPAIAEGRVEVLRHPLAKIPSSSVARITAEIARRLHPTHDAAIDTAEAATADETPTTVSTIGVK